MNKIFGTRIAVLTGDFLFAQSSWFLANLDNLEVGCNGSQQCCLELLVICQQT